MKNVIAIVFLQIMPSFLGGQNYYSLCPTSPPESIDQCANLESLKAQCVTEYANLNYRVKQGKELDEISKDLHENLLGSIKDIIYLKSKIDSFYLADTDSIILICNKILSENFIAREGRKDHLEVKDVVPEIKRLVNAQVKFSGDRDENKDNSEVLLEVPRNIIFGEVEINTGKTLECRISNVGNLPVEVLIDEISEYYSSDLPKDSLIKIEPKETFALNIAFEPNIVQSYEGLIVIRADENEQLYYNVKLIGEGIKEPKGCNCYKISTFFLLTALLGGGLFYLLKIRPQYRSHLEELNAIIYKNADEFQKAKIELATKSGDRKSALESLKQENHSLGLDNSKYRSKIRELKYEIEKLSNPKTVKKEYAEQENVFGLETSHSYKSTYHHDIEEDGQSLKISKGTNSLTPRSMYELREFGDKMNLWLRESPQTTKLLIDYSKIQLEPFFEIPHPPKVGIDLIRTQTPAKFRREGEFWVLLEKGKAVFL